MADAPIYQQQIEAGKKIVSEMLQELASSLQEPQINDLRFRILDQDIDHGQESLFDPNQSRIVLKISRDNLADAPETPRVRSKLESQISASVREYFGECKCNHARSLHVGGTGQCSATIALLEKRTGDGRSWAVPMSNPASSSLEEPCGCEEFRPRR